MNKRFLIAVTLIETKKQWEKFTINTGARPSTYPVLGYYEDAPSGIVGDIPISRFIALPSDVNITELKKLLPIFGYQLKE